MCTSKVDILIWLLKNPILIFTSTWAGGPAGKSFNLLKPLHYHLAEILEFCTTQHEGIHFSMNDIKSICDRQANLSEKEVHPDELARIKLTVKDISLPLKE